MSRSVRFDHEETVGHFFFSRIPYKEAPRVKVALPKLGEFRCGFITFDR